MNSVRGQNDLRRTARCSSLSVCHFVNLLAGRQHDGTIFIGISPCEIYGEIYMKCSDANVALI